MLQSAGLWTTQVRLLQMKRLRDCAQRMWQGFAALQARLGSPVVPSASNATIGGSFSLMFNRQNKFEVVYCLLCKLKLVEGMVILQSNRHVIDHYFRRVFVFYHRFFLNLC